MTATQSPTQTVSHGRWCPDPFRRYEMRWWDGNRWTEHVSSSGQQLVDPLGTAPPAPDVPGPVAPTEDWRTRPVSNGTYALNLFLCLLFPIIFIPWYSIKYTLRGEYPRAVGAVVVPIVVLMVMTAVFAA